MSPVVKMIPGVGRVEKLDGGGYSGFRSSGRPVPGVFRTADEVIAELVQAMEKETEFRSMFSDLPSAFGRIERAEGRNWFAEGAIEGIPIVGLVAPEKKGKTWAALDLLVATAVGDAWLGRFPICRTGPAIIVDAAENGEADIARRVARLARGRGRDPKRILADVRHMWTADLMLRAGNDKLEQLVRACEAMRPAVIVLDPWRNVIDGDESSTPDTIRSMVHVARLRELGAVVVILHHVNKDGRSSGARALLGRCDLFLEGVQRADGADPVFRTIGRTLQPQDPIAQSFRIELAHDREDDERYAETRVAFAALAERRSGPSSAPVSTATPIANGNAAAGELSPTARRVLDRLHQNDAEEGVTKTQLRKELVLNAPTARKVLEELEAQGLARRGDEDRWFAVQEAS